MLYVLDEPSIGLHPRDVQRLVDAVRRLQRRANTVVVVEHEEAMIRAAEQVIEVGPGPANAADASSFKARRRKWSSRPTASPAITWPAAAARRRGQPPAAESRLDPPGRRRGNNLQGVTVEFPLGLLCLVTGVSGSGKSTLVQDTLYPALCRRLRKDAPKPHPLDDVFGDGQIDDVMMVDQSPIGRSPRSNPVTYLKAFDEIRAVFAETVEARTRNYDAGHFSFNVDGGRCSVCHGDGHVQIDMQFLPDVYMKCGQCGGTRYRDEILDVTYRGRNIAEVLEMTVREAFTFFRGQPKVQARLKRLIDVGLDYVRLGQPANTLSGGEAQRLKLAGIHVRGETRPLPVPPRRADHGAALFRHRAVVGLLRRAVGGGPFADRRRAQFANDDGRRLHHRPWPRRRRGGRAGRRQGDAGKGRPRRRLRHRGLFGEGAAGAVEGGVGVGLAAGGSFSAFFAAGLFFAFSALPALSARGPRDASAADTSPANAAAIRRRGG